MPYRVAVLIAALAVLPATTSAQTADNLLLVVNGASPQSIQIADHYAEVRHVPGRNIVRIKATDADTISRADFESTIQAPIAAWLAKQRLQDQVLFIVLTKGVPLRVDGTGGPDGTVASVDSELTLLYRRMVGKPVSSVGHLANPYFLGDRPMTEAARFSRITSDLYLVTRLDGFTVDDVLKLIDRGASPVRDGQIVLDQKATVIDQSGDAWLALAAERLRQMSQGTRTALETSRALASNAGPVLGYFSWGSNDPANQRRQMGLQYANGAIGGMFVSTDGRTFREPGPAWRPAMAGSTTGGQSLIGDLIREGITGVSGHVTEPYLDASIRPQVLFPAYLSGFTLAESFYLAMPYLSWQDIVVGDPLCAPFMQAVVPAEQLHKGIDAETDLPALFAERALAIAKASNLNLAGVKLSLKGFSLQAQGRPESEVDGFLAQAVALEPRLTAPLLQLGSSAEARKDYDGAVSRYRAVLAVEPDNISALNNLAYLLADQKGAAKEALPLATRAYRLSGQAAVVADTLGWVHYKLGDLAAAMPFLDAAARQEPANIDILVHAAAVHAGLNDLPKARSYLDAALKVDPKTAERDDVKALAARIR